MPQQYKTNVKNLRMFLYKKSCPIFSLISVDPVAATPPPRSEARAVAPGSRRTSAPPAVNSQCSQRALLREKCKENQLERNGCQQHKDVDKSGFDIGEYA